MSEKTVVLKEKVETCGDVVTKKIVADPPGVVLKNKNWKIKFENNLSAKAEIRFYEVGDKGGALVGDFCPKVDADDVLRVDAGEKKNCKSDAAGYYSYTVEATGYQTLDPVLIIEPLFASSSFLASMSPLLVSAAVGGVAVLGVQRFLAQRKSKKAAV